MAFPRAPKVPLGLRPSLDSAPREEATTFHKNNCVKTLSHLQPHLTGKCLTGWAYMVHLNLHLEAHLKTHPKVIINRTINIHCCVHLDMLAPSTASVSAGSASHKLPVSLLRGAKGDTLHLRQVDNSLCLPSADLGLTEPPNFSKGLSLSVQGTL